MSLLFPTLDALFNRAAARVAALLLFLCGVALGQQTVDQSSERGSLEGTVINSQNGRIVPRASVIVRNLKRMSEARSVRADSQGHFLMKGVVPGSYRLSAEHQSYFSSTRHQIFQYRVDLAPGEQRGGIVLSLQPAAVVTGQITDENSEPLQHVQVQLLDRLYRNGRLAVEVAGTALSDDRGTYRIYDVRPGSYYLLAEVLRSGPAAPASAAAKPGTASEAPPESDIAYSPVFYPDTADFLQAHALPVSAGEEVLDGITGEPVPSAAVAALWTEYLDITGIIVNTSSKDGTFEVRDLPPGTYTLRAAFTHEETAYTVQRRVEVGPSGLDNIELNALPDTLIAGHLHAEAPEASEGQQRRLPRIEVDFQSNTSAGRASAVAGLANGGAAAVPELPFQARLHPGDQYTVSVRGLPENFYLKSVRVNGHPVERNEVETSDQRADIDLVISPMGGYVEGLVLDDSGQPIPGAAVVLVPDDSRRNLADLFRKSTSDKDGKFRIRGVPPGDYELLAFDDVDLNELISQPEVLRRFDDRAVRFAVEEQTDYSTALKIIRGAEEIRSSTQ
jgi:protocatechuate 3,4-dioxygenase beta subunit